MQINLACQPLQSRISMILMILCYLWPVFLSKSGSTIHWVHLHLWGRSVKWRQNQPAPGWHINSSTALRHSSHWVGKKKVWSPMGDTQPATSYHDATTCNKHEQRLWNSNLTTMWLGAMVTQKVHTKWWPSELLQIYFFQLVSCLGWRIGLKHNWNLKCLKPPETGNFVPNPHLPRSRKCLDKTHHQWAAFKTYLVSLFRLNPRNGQNNLYQFVINILNNISEKSSWVSSRKQAGFWELLQVPLVSL